MRYNNFMSSIEEQLVEARLKEYTEAAKDSANVDKAALAIAALESVQLESRVPIKKKKKLYLFSLILPPIGLVFGVWYFFSKKIDGKQVGVICAALTFLSLLLTWLTLSLFTSAIPSQSLGQIESWDSGDLQGIQDLLR
jgi:hypothetical protein